MSRLTRDWLGCWLKDFLGLDDNFANASAVDLCHQLNLVDRLADLVLFEILHQLCLEDRHIERIAVHIPEIILDVKELALAKNRLHDLGMAGFDSLLGSWSDDSGTLGVTNLVFSGPLATEDALVFQPRV